MSDQAIPSVSFYSLSAINNKGETISFNLFKNKKILIVNTASECGYTPQYKGLEKLYQEHKENLVILAFPSNDFGKQEPGTDTEISTFCSVNYGISFPIFAKSEVIKSNNQNEVYQWLTQPEKNGWNHHEPDWNFNKYLINEEGELTHYFSSGVTPDSEELLNALQF